MDAFAETTRHVFEALTESLEAGEPLPAEVLITYLRHPEAAMQRLAARLLQHRHGQEELPFVAEVPDPALQQSIRQMLTLLAEAERRARAWPRQFSPK